MQVIDTRLLSGSWRFTFPFTQTTHNYFSYPRIHSYTISQHSGSNKDSENTALPDTKKTCNIQ